MYPRIFVSKLTKQDVIIHQKVRANDEKKNEKNAYFWHSAAIPGKNVILHCLDENQDPPPPPPHPTTPPAWDEETPSPLQVKNDAPYLFPKATTRWNKSNQLIDVKKKRFIHIWRVIFSKQQFNFV